MTDRPRLKPDGQPMRLLRWLRDNPGATSIDMTKALWIANTTGRISDLRRAGYVIECRKDGDGHDRYYIRERRPELIRGEQIRLSL